MAQSNLTNWPRPPSPVDVFRRVCSASQRKRVPGPNSTIENYLVRDLPADAQRVHKVLVKETVRTGGLTYETQLCTIDYVKALETLEITCANGDVTAASIAGQIRHDYEATKGTINSYGVRELIRKILLDVNATNVRGPGGGVYFVSNAHKATVDSLEQLASLIPGDVLVHSLQLLDDGKQREMLRRAYESETAEEADRVVNEMAELAAEVKAGRRRLDHDRVNTYLEVLARYRGKAREYKQLLSSSLDTADSRLDIMQGQIQELLNLVTV
jgi:hypothetical protein